MTDDAIVEYRRRCWALVPIPSGQKGPTAPGWQTRQWQPSDFRPGGNVGVILGPRSGNLVDIDLDCLEALALADIYLPATGAVFGRLSRPRSHRLYVSSGGCKANFADPIGGEMLVELRAPGREGKAHQTLLPPSVADDERREWEGGQIEPARFDADKLRRRCAWLAIGCLVMRHVSETAARRPGSDLPNLLYEADPVLGRRAFDWLGLPNPDVPRYSAKAWSELSGSEVTLRELADAIPNNNESWDDWNAFGLAFFAESRGSDEGFIAFDRFSAKSAKYNGPETAARWRHFAKSPPSATGIGKLMKAALAAGWRPQRLERRCGT